MQDTLKQPHTDALLTKTESISGAEAVMRAFVKEGVETIFGYPGGAIMPIYDALYANFRAHHLLQSKGLKLPASENKGPVLPTLFLRKLLDQAERAA